MRRVLAASVLVAVAGVPGAHAGPAQAPPRVCEGLTICSPIAGPWVVAPGPVPPGLTAGTVWQLGCPDGVVGGIDARVANPWIEVTFPGLMGSPINPGVTTRRTIVFNALSVGPPGRPSSFIPFIGCIPSEGGPRTPTGVAARAQFGPQPIQRRVRIVEVRARRVRAGFACKRGERMVSSTAALGIYTALRPTARQLGAVSVTRSVVNGRVFITVTRNGLPLTIPVQVQIHVLCSGRLAA